ncbi:hypothetical protein BCR43DRAFT_295210 [Syncephalastrum racemosum]|uniref:Uncharacterized protein n=1 Tax=Syncephalastrum racemosum TaxID=13706 RepID=A0A1X2H986_SYNRA|nr:hypothetical protein BCR43DRAFT_295210 [Syncephalastrum racemosum]
MHLVGKVSLVPPIRSSRTSIFSSFASLLCFRNRFVLRGSFSLRRTMKSHVQFLGQSSPEGPPTLIIHYDKHRYMFNCREVGVHGRHVWHASDLGRRRCPQTRYLRRQKPDPQFGCSPFVRVQNQFRDKRT